ncbi:MAG TPA: malto-oligosyltrehalose synthase, partial [Bryobacteraceae bacterium]|nr:malto-oligosyltrehalose synthase [Bryobacteraceae bacterium]
GLPKLWTVYHTLRARRENPESFGSQDGYHPLQAVGSCAAHLLGYMRGNNIVVLVPRLVIKLGAGWQDTQIALPQKKWLNRFTGAVLSGGDVAVSEIFQEFPVALLVEQ